MIEQSERDGEIEVPVWPIPGDEYDAIAAEMGPKYAAWESASRWFRAWLAEYPDVTREVVGAPLGGSAYEASNWWFRVWMTVYPDEHRNEWDVLLEESQQEGNK